MSVCSTVLILIDQLLAAENWRERDRILSEIADGVEARQDPEWGGTLSSCPHCGR